MKILIDIIILVALGIVQVSFLSTWLFPINSLNLILSLIIFVTVIVSYKKGLWWAFGLGIFLELYSALPFGIISLSLFFVVILVNFLFSNIFTNRSFYSLLILGLIGTIFYNLIIFFLYLILLVTNFDVSFFNFNFWIDFIWQPILNAIILSVVFFAYYISTNRLNIFISHSS